MAGSLVLLIVLVPASVFFTWSYQNEKGAVEGEARIIASLVTEFINHNAGLWRFEKERLGLILSKYGSDRYGFQINDSQGNSIVSESPPLSRPLLKRIHPIYDFGTEAGSVMVLVSMHSVLVKTVMIALTGLILGILLYCFMRLIPIRALRQATQALMESENAYRNLVELSPDGIYINKDEKIAYINAAGVKLFGAERAEELIGTSFWDRLHPDSHAVVRDRLRHIHEKKGAVPLREERYICVDGSEFPVEVAAAPFVYQGRMALQVVFHDLTNRKRKEADLRHARDAAQKASLAKSEFLAVMSHEIRTPLNGVLGMAELLHNTHLGAQQRRYTSMILESGKSLLSIVNDILDFSKIEAGRMELDKCAFDPTQMVEDLATMMADQAHGKGLELIIDLPSALPSSLIGDPIRLRQILVNLVGNAIKFTSDGEVLVRLSHEKQDANGSITRFEVRDTGIGIDESRQEDIFRSFTQSERSTSRRFGGTGLGLTISQRLVQLMGDEIRLESRLGAGTTFWFELALPVGSTDDPPISWSNEKFAGRRVLIVDNDSTQRTVLKTRLEEFGLQVDAAIDENDTLDPLKRDDFDLALVDLETPYVSGAELALKIRRIAKSTRLPLVLLTSKLPDDWPVDSAGCDGQELLHKPVRRDALYLALERALCGPGDAVLSPTLTGGSQTASFTAHVLVAEDNPVNQELARAVLAVLGCTAEIVENGIEAVKVIRQQDFDLILMDCFMPVMDGFAATTEIRAWETSQRLAATPIIALTANVIKGFRDQCIESGMDDYLSKPFTQDQLAEILARWLEKSSAPESKIADRR